MHPQIEPADQPLATLLQMSQLGPEWFTLERLAGEMGIAPRTVLSLVRRGKLPKPLVNTPKVKCWHRYQFVRLVEQRMK